MVDRYDPIFDDEAGESEMVVEDHGDYVSFEDYQMLFFEKEEIQDKFEQLKGLIEDMNWEAGKIRV